VIVVRIDRGLADISAIEMVELVVVDGAVLIAGAGWIEVVFLMKGGGSNVVTV
jgi:hypothetical protein